MKQQVITHHLRDHAKRKETCIFFVLHRTYRSRTVLAPCAMSEKISEY